MPLPNIKLAPNLYGSLCAKCEFFAGEYKKQDAYGMVKEGRRKVQLIRVLCIEITGYPVVRAYCGKFKGVEVR